MLGCYNEVRAEYEYKEASEIINLFNNISWRIIANNKIVDASESNWITNTKYNESITKVIAKAVADCITDKNEFANKGANDVITFAVEVKSYTHENWNAVVLWNYLHVLKWDYLNNITRSKDEIFKEIRKNISAKYPTEGVEDLSGKLNKAISDIKAYDKELSLADEMKKFSDIYKRTKGATLESIIRQNTRITPIADWVPVGTNLPSKIKGEDITKIDITQNYVGSIMLFNVMLEQFLPVLTPIKVKLKNGIYFINQYRFWANIPRDIPIESKYDMESISVKKSLTIEQAWNNYDGNYDLEIRKEIYKKILTLFEDIASPLSFTTKQFCGIDSK